MAFELATGEMLFSPKGSKESAANLDHLSLIWETLGGIPQYITEKGTHARQYFKNGKLLGVILILVEKNSFVYQMVF